MSELINYQGAYTGAEIDDAISRATQHTTKTLSAEGWYSIGYFGVRGTGNQAIVTVGTVSNGSIQGTGFTALVLCTRNNPRITILSARDNATLPCIRLVESGASSIAIEVYYGRTTEMTVFANVVSLARGKFTMREFTPSNATTSYVEQQISATSSGNVLTDASGVKKSGDTMTGVLNQVHGSYTASYTATTTGPYINTWDANDNAVALMFYTADQTLRIRRKPSGGSVAISELLHTGNKPSGSYTGNGSATYREIKTGGIGKACAVWGGGAVAFVTPDGAIVKTPAEGATGLTSGRIKFKDGVLSVATADANVNTNGTTYYYQVL